MNSPSPIENCAKFISFTKMDPRPPIDPPGCYTKVIESQKRTLWSFENFFTLQDDCGPRSVFNHEFNLIRTTDRYKRCESLSQSITLLCVPHWKAYIFPITSEGLLKELVSLPRSFNRFPPFDLPTAMEAFRGLFPPLRDPRQQSGQLLPIRPGHQPMKNNLP